MPDDQIRKDLEDIQPPTIDTRLTIAPENVTNVANLPRGACSGTLIPFDVSNMFRFYFC